MEPNQFINILFENPTWPKQFTHFQLIFSLGQKEPLSSIALGQGASKCVVLIGLFLFRSRRPGSNRCARLTLRSSVRDRRMSEVT